MKSVGLTLGIIARKFLDAARLTHSPLSLSSIPPAFSSRYCFHTAGRTQYLRFNVTMILCIRVTRLRPPSRTIIVEVINESVANTNALPVFLEIDGQILSYVKFHGTHAIDIRT